MWQFVEMPDINFRKTTEPLPSWQLQAVELLLSTVPDTLMTAGFAVFPQRMPFLRALIWGDFAQTSSNFASVLEEMKPQHSLIFA